jgi:hypothetical protein
VPPATVLTAASTGHADSSHQNNRLGARFT